MSTQDQSKKLLLDNDDLAERSESDLNDKSNRGSAAPVNNWLVNTLYGDISVDELKKFGMLGAIFLFIIGSYWLLRPLKDAVFFTIVGGREYQPYAKMLSVVVVAVVVVIYSELVDRFSRERLFYLVMAFFAVSFFALSVLLSHPTIGLENMEASPTRLIGWFTYFLVECYGSITVSMFWSFVASCTQSKSAQRGYSLIIGGAQIGSITGPLLAANAQTLGVVPLFGIAGFCAIAVGGLVRLFTILIPAQVMAAQPGRTPKAESHLNATAKKEHPTESDVELGLDESEVEVYQTRGEDEIKQNKAKKTAQEGPPKRAGFFEGLSLIATKPYLMGVALISTLYEVIATITDYQMKVLAHDAAANDPAALAAFLGTFGMATNGLALVAALVGTSFALRHFGLRWCLLAYPVAVAGASCVLFLFASSDPEFLIKVFFGVMVLTKGLSYALNNPAKEIMYIPTSKAVKYKAKSWIDLFGSRSAKAVGSTVTSFLKNLGSTEAMVETGVFVSLGIVGVWLVAASRVGHMYTHLVANQQTIS